MKHRRARQAGFTLLETIVTLVIVSLLVAVLMQALNQTLNLRTRLLRHQGEARLAALQEAWFRDSVAAALIDLPDGLGEMRGNSTAVDFVTARPLAGSGPARVRWSLQRGANGIELRYGDERLGEVTAVPGPLYEARFAYLGVDGQWHDVWEPETEADERLPRLVRFEARTGRGTIAWWVAIASDPRLPTRLRRNESGVY